MFLLGIKYNLTLGLLRVSITEKSLYVRNYCAKKSYKLLFFGSDSIALSSFKKVNEFRKKENLINRLDLVVTNNSKIKSEVEKYAQKEEIRTIQWPLENLKVAEYDLGLIVAFGHLIREDILSKFPLGMVNVHPSLLPRWRGAAPIIYTLMHGDTVAGVSLMKIKADIFDVGEIISQKSVDIPKDVKLPQLTTHLSELGADMLVECIRNLPDSLNNAQPQSNEGVTYAKKINKDISEIRWSEMNAEQVFNLYRSIYGIYSLTTKFRDKQIKLFECFLHNTSENEQEHKTIGSIEYCPTTDAIRVLCKDRKYVYFKSLRIVGKRRITALDFYNGYVKNVSMDKKNNLNNEIIFKCS